MSKKIIRTYSRAFSGLPPGAWMLSLVVLINRSGPKNTGKYMGLFNFNFAFSMVVGPVTGSWIYENAGPEFLWYFIALPGFLVVAGFKTLDSVMQKQINK